MTLRMASLRGRRRMKTVSAGSWTTLLTVSCQFTRCRARAGHGATNRRTLRDGGAIGRKGLVRALFGLAAVVARLVGDRWSELSAPQSTPGERSAGAEALFGQANAIRRNGDGERLTVDLDLAADGLIKLRCHGEKYTESRLAFRLTRGVPGSWFLVP